MNDIPSTELGQRLDAGRTLELHAEDVRHILDLIEAGQRGAVFNLVADWHPADLARLMSHLPFDAAKQLFQWLPVEQAGETLPELDDDFRAKLLKAVLPARIKALLDELDTDDAADVLADLPEDVAQQVLPTLEDAEDVKELLEYDEKTAGGIMATEFVAVPPGWTVVEATREVRRQAELMEHLYALFITDAQGHLQGCVSLEQLILSPATALMSDIMNPNMVFVTPDMDQEDVARIMERYDLILLPVVDEVGRLIGRITIDDVVDVIREEAEEDIQRMSGVSGGTEPTDSVPRIVRGRLPWLVIGMVGSALGALVILQFEAALEEATVLAAFIPLVAATAGNAGIQSSAVAVQGLASGSIWTSDVLTRLIKEFAVAILDGLGAAIVVVLFVLAVEMIAPGRLEHAVALALTIGLALIVVITMATLIGATVPLLLDHMGIDPAVSTGPFITVSNDILGIFIYFVSATLIYLN